MRKIVITGPESTGKTTLANQLAEHFGSVVVPEYSREYLEEYGLSYSYDDLLSIAQGQVDLEDRVISRFGDLPMPVFLDTDLLVMKVWCEVKFGECHKWILDQLAVRRGDLYLLCDVDLPWEPDVMREAPSLETRQVLMRHYREGLVGLDIPWAIITGENRLEQAIKIVDRSWRSDG